MHEEADGTRGDALVGEVHVVAARALVAGDAVIALRAAREARLAGARARLLPGASRAGGDARVGHRVEQQAACAARAVSSRGRASRAVAVAVCTQPREANQTNEVVSKLPVHVVALLWKVPVGQEVTQLPSDSRKFEEQAVQAVLLVHDWQLEPHAGQQEQAVV